MRGSLVRCFRLARDNLVTVLTIGVALYALGRGLFIPYTAANDVFLLAVIVGLMGFNAVDGLIERHVRLREMDTKIRKLSLAAEQTTKDLAALNDGLAAVGLSVSGLRLGSSATQLLIEQPSIPAERIQRAAKIYWSGVTLRSSLRQRLNDLKVALAHGADIRLLIIDPSNTQLKEELTVRQGEKYEYVDAVLKSTVLNLQLLADTEPDGASFQLGLHRVFPTYGLTILDPDDPDGVCYVELYHSKRSKESTFVVHATADAAWYRFFVDQFQAMMNRSAVFEIRRPPDVDAAVERGASYEQ
jgi:hypothetical protein